MMATKMVSCKNCLNPVEIENTVCKVCKSSQDRLNQIHQLSDDPNSILDFLRSFRNKKYLYDVSIGISGGVDSCMVATLAGEAGLRAKLVHFDNGWNTNKANENILSICRKYNFHLETHIMDWDTFKGLQRSFILAGVPDIELVTDHAIFATMIDQLRKYESPIFLSGANYATEHGLDLGRLVWNKLDILNIYSINKRFDNVSLKKYPKSNPISWAKHRFFDKKAKIETPLNSFWYKRNKAIDYMNEKFGFQDYGFKHEESIFTKVYQRVILRNKFNCIKILPHLNAQIRNKEITKSYGKKELDSFLENRSLESYEIEYVREKLSFSKQEWEEIQMSEANCHSDFLNIGVYMEPIMRIMSILKLRSMD